MNKLLLFPIVVLTACGQHSAHNRDSLTPKQRTERIADLTTNGYSSSWSSGDSSGGSEYLNISCRQKVSKLEFFPLHTCLIQHSKNSGATHSWIIPYRPLEWLTTPWSWKDVTEIPSFRFARKATPSDLYQPKIPDLSDGEPEILLDIGEVCPKGKICWHNGSEKLWIADAHPRCWLYQWFPLKMYVPCSMSEPQSDSTKKWVFEETFFGGTARPSHSCGSTIMPWETCTMGADTNAEYTPSGSVLQDDGTMLFSEHSLIEAQCKKRLASHPVPVRMAGSEPPGELKTTRCEQEESPPISAAPRS